MADGDLLTALDFAHVWHPFTPMRQWRLSEPCIIERGEGFELIDVEGRRYIDGFSSLWCNVHGHCVPEIDGAVREQLCRVAHATMLGHATIPAIELAAMLADAAPSAPGSAPLRKVFYSDAGATAVEAAIKMAIGAWHHRGEEARKTVVSLSGAYHGDTIGAMSVGYMEAFHAPYGRLVFRRRSTPAPDVARLGARVGRTAEWPSWNEGLREQARNEALDALDRALDEVGDGCAAVVIEPVMQGAAGMIEQPEGFAAGVAERARSHGALLIADEVATGFARTGAMFACELEGVAPDILCLGKGISGGYLPLAATMATDWVAESFEGAPEDGKTFYHGHTYTGNPLACAAAIASLGLIHRRGVVPAAKRASETIRRALQEGLGDHPSVGDVRNRGVMTGIELVRSRHRWRPLPAEAQLASAVCAEARRRGLLIRPLGDVVVFNPAPAIDAETLERALPILVESVRTACP